MKLTAVIYISIIYLVISLLCCCSCASDREEYEHPISFLDGDSMRSMYRSFRDFAMRIIGQTGRRTRGTFLQDTDTKFPCNVTGMRSSIVPTSVHRLKPGMNGFFVLNLISISKRSRFYGFFCDFIWKQSIFKKIVWEIQKIYTWPGFFFDQDKH